MRRENTELKKRWEHHIHQWLQSGKSQVQYCKEHNLPSKETSVVEDLKQAAAEYLKWIPSKGYTQGTQNCYRQNLNQFTDFISRRRFLWNEIFTLETVNTFMNVSGHRRAFGIRGLARYLFLQGKIKRPIETETRGSLPCIYEEYLKYYAKIHKVQRGTITGAKRILRSFHCYLIKNKTALSELTIEHVDAFITEFTYGLEPKTGNVYRSAFRGFLRYLYHEREVLKRDLAQLVIGAPCFGQSKPPAFLRPHEIESLFDVQEVSTASGLRTYAMIQLAWSLGLRPKEVSLIRLDDISFKKHELCLTDRKNNTPVLLPVPEETIKAVAAYIIGARPSIKHRLLFTSLKAPYQPVTSQGVSRCIKVCMQKAGLSSKPYHLRHTYARNLLEQGASIFEIKEMLGHDELQSSMAYIAVDTKLMRKVLFNETV